MESASEVDVIEKIIWYRTRGQRSDLGSWLLAYARSSIKPEVFSHPRLFELNAGELMLLRAVSPSGVFTPKTKQIYLRRWESSEDALADALFQQHDSSFLSAALEVGATREQLQALGAICKMAYQQYLRPPDRIVEGLY